MQETLFSRLTRIDHLIRIKGTGSPADLADKLAISKRSVSNYLQFMKEQGAPIKYCSFRESYYYEEEGYFFVSCRFIREKLETDN